MPSLYLYLFSFALIFVWGLSTGFRFRLASDYYGGHVQPVPRFTEFICWVLVILLVTACFVKPEEIADYAMYQHYYKAISLSNDPKESLEPTYRWITWISPSFPILIFIYALLSVGLNVWVIQRYSCNIPVSLLLYLSPFFVLHDMIQIRVAVSCALILWAVTYIPNKDWKRYFALIFIACLFHISSIVFIPVFFLSGKRMFKAFYFAVIIALLIAALIHVSIGLLIKYIPIPAIQTYYMTYTLSVWNDAPGVGLVIFGKSIMALLMILNINTIQRAFPYAIISLKIFILSIACFILFTDIPVMAGRLFELTGIIDIYAMAMFPLISTKWKNVLALLPAAFAVFRLQFAIGLLTSSIDL